MALTFNGKGLFLILISIFVLSYGNDVDSKGGIPEDIKSFKAETTDDNTFHENDNLKPTLPSEKKKESEIVVDGVEQSQADSEAAFLQEKRVQQDEISNAEPETSGKLESKKDNVEIEQQEKDTEAEESAEDTKVNFLGSIWKMFIADDLDKGETNPSTKDNKNSSAKVDPPSPLNLTLESIDSNVSLTFNATSTVEDADNVNKTEKKFKFHCVGKNLTGVENVTSYVKIVNSSRLLTLLNFDKNDSICDCVLVLFYAPWCPFCAQLAPSYNALARAFPQLEVVAVDAAQFSNLNARFGTVLVPNILLFHHSRAFARYNQTERNLNSLVHFIHNITGLDANFTVNITEADLDGPLSSIPTQDADYLLYLAWMFVIVFTSVIFVQSSFGQQWINKVRLLWQEHQHID